MNTTFLTISAAALALTGTAAIANHHGKMNPDANGDGVVTQDERKAARDAMRAEWKAKREARQNQ